MVCGNFILPEPASYVFFYTIFNLRNLLYIISGHYTVALEEIEGCIADQKTVEDEIEARELARTIEAFLDTLTAKERVIFMRRYAYADTYADIAKRVGISEKNVSVRLTLIRQKMKQFLIEREVFV